MCRKIERPHRHAPIPPVDRLPDAVALISPEVTRNTYFNPYQPIHSQRQPNQSLPPRRQRQRIRNQQQQRRRPVNYQTNG